MVAPRLGGEAAFPGRSRRAVGRDPVAERGIRPNEMAGPRVGRELAVDPPLAIDQHAHFARSAIHRGAYIGRAGGRGHGRAAKLRGAIG